MSRFLSLDELLNKKKAQASKPIYVAPVIEDTPIVEDAPKVEDTPIVEDTPKVEDTPVIEDAPVKPVKKGGKKAAVEA